MFEGMVTQLGSFELTGTVLRVSDPCYDRDVWCCGTVENCIPGTWDAAILTKDEEPWGNRVAVLSARHSTGPKHTAINRALCNRTHKWKHCEFEVGVDSGQAGIFDEAHYKDNSIFGADVRPKNSYGDLWYSVCCDLTLSRLNAGILPYGAVSSSGYGDGGYDCITHTNEDGQIDFVFIVFICDEDDEAGSKD